MSSEINDLIGQVIGNYRLTSLLARGGMSAVFLGQPQNNPRPPVAIKILLPSASFTPEEPNFSKARFIREIRTVTRLRHEHILPVLDYGKVNGLPYLIMPFISGGTLATRLAVKDGPLPFTEIARILVQIASALDYAHQQGVIHRDIKPTNILLDEHGKVYLADFGIARLFDSSRNTMGQDATSLTMTGEVIGTPNYMAPEQFMEAQAGPPADIYALGVILYWLVTGRLPFQASNPLATAMQQLHENPPPPRLLRPALPEPAEAAMLCALAKDPAARFASAGALVQAFEAGVHGRWAEGVARQYVPSRQGELALPSSRTAISATMTSSAQVSPILSTGQPSRPAKLINRLPHPRLALSGLLMIGIICLAVLLGDLTGRWALHSTRPSGSTPGPVLKTQSAAPHLPSGTAPSIEVKGNDVSATQFGSGAAHWHFFTQGQVSQPPVVFDSVVYVGTDAGYVYALRTSDGVLLWASHPGSGVATPLVIMDRVIYYTTAHYFVHALHLSTGQSLWTYHIGNPIRSVLRVSNGIVSAQTEDGPLYTLRASDGVVLARTQQQLISVYIHANSLYALPGAGQSPLWTFSANGQVSQPPVVFDGVVYAGTDAGYVYALRTSDGVLLWTFHAGSSVATPLTIANGVLYFSSVHNYVHAVRLDTGTRLWTYHTPSPIISPATVARGVDYVYTRDGTVYLLQASSGKLLSTTTALSW